MDVEGVDAATIYPMATLEALVLDDRKFGLARIRAYNDWLLDEFCGADPRRLIALPIISVDDGNSVMLEETERVIAKGARGIFRPTSPSGLITTRGMTRCGTCWGSRRWRLPSTGPWGVAPWPRPPWGR